MMLAEWLEAQGRLKEMALGACIVYHGEDR